MHIFLALIALWAFCAVALGSVGVFGLGSLYFRRRHHDHLIPGAPRSWRAAT